MTRHLSLSSEGGLLSEVLNRPEVLFDALTKQVIVIGTWDHEESLFLRFERLKERPAFGEWNQVVPFAVDDQAGFV